VSAFCAYIIRNAMLKVEMVESQCHEMGIVPFKGVEKGAVYSKARNVNGRCSDEDRK
jgi:hypothetical protein